MKLRIPLNKYVMDESLSWEERYRQLEAHHEDETGFLIDYITRFENLLDEYTEKWKP